MTRPPTKTGRPRIRARKPNGQAAQILPRTPEAIGEALARIAAGDSVRAIADDIGVSDQAIRMWLLDEVPEQYRLFQRRGLLMRIVEADQQLEAATDPVGIARARELCRFARWDAERRLPQLFGPRQQIEMTVRSDAAERLRAAKMRVIDAATGEFLASTAETDRDPDRDQTAKVPIQS